MIVSKAALLAELDFLAPAFRINAAGQETLTFRGQQSRLTLIADNTAMQGVSRIALETPVAEDFAVAVRGPIVHTYVRSLPAGPIELLTAGGLRDGLTLRYRDGVVTFAPLPTVLYERNPERSIRAATFGRGAILSLIEQTDFCAVDYDHPRIPGAQLTFGQGRVRMANTDVHTIAVADTAAPPEMAGELVIPARTLPYVKTMLKTSTSVDVTLSVRERTLLIDTDTRTLIVQASQGRFPSYTTLLASPATVTIEAESEALRTVLARVLVASGEDLPTVRMTAADNTLTFESGGSRETCDVVYAGDQQPYTARYEGQRLTKILAAIATDRVTLQGTAGAALIVRPQDSTTAIVTMPLS